MFRIAALDPADLAALANGEVLQCAVSPTRAAALGYGSGGAGAAAGAGAPGAHVRQPLRGAALDAGPEFPSPTGVDVAAGFRGTGGAGFDSDDDSDATMASDGSATGAPASGAGEPAGILGVRNWLSEAVAGALHISLPLRIVMGEPGVANVLRALGVDNPVTAGFVGVVCLHVPDGDALGGLAPVAHMRALSAAWCPDSFSWVLAARSTVVVGGEAVAASSLLDLLTGDHYRVYEAADGRSVGPLMALEQLFPGLAAAEISTRVTALDRWAAAAASDMRSSAAQGELVEMRNAMAALFMLVMYAAESRTREPTRPLAEGWVSDRLVLAVWHMFGTAEWLCARQLLGLRDGSVGVGPIRFRLRTTRSHRRIRSAGSTPAASRRRNAAEVPPLPAPATADELTAAQGATRAAALAALGDVKFDSAVRFNIGAPPSATRGSIREGSPGVGGGSSWPRSHSSACASASPAVAPSADPGLLTAIQGLAKLVENSVAEAGAARGEAEARHGEAVARHDALAAQVSASSEQAAQGVLAATEAGQAAAAVAQSQQTMSEQLSALGITVAALQAGTPVASVTVGALPAGPAAALTIPNGGPGVGRLALPPADGSGPPRSPVSAKTAPTRVDDRHEPGLSYGATAADIAAANVAAATERSSADYMAAATEAAAIDRQVADLIVAHQRGTNMLAASGRSAEAARSILAHQDAIDAQLTLLHSQRARLGVTPLAHPDYGSRPAPSAAASPVSADQAVQQFRLMADTACRAASARAADVSAAELLPAVMEALAAGQALTDRLGSQCDEDAHRMTVLRDTRAMLISGSDAVNSPQFMRGGHLRAPGGGLGAGDPGTAGGAAASPFAGARAGGSWRVGGCGLGGDGRGPYGYGQGGDGGGGATDHGGGGGYYGGYSSPPRSHGHPDGSGAGGGGAAYGGRGGDYEGDGGGYGGRNGVTSIGTFACSEGGRVLQKALAKESIDVPDLLATFFGVRVWSAEAVIRVVGSINPVWAGAIAAAVASYKLEMCDPGMCSRTEAAIMRSNVVMDGKVQVTAVEKYFPGLGLLLVAVRLCRVSAGGGAIHRVPLDAAIRVLAKATLLATTFHCNRVASSHGWSDLPADHPLKQAFVVEFAFYPALASAFVEEVADNGLSAGVALVEYTVTRITTCISATTASNAVVHISQRFFLYALACQQCMQDGFRNRRWKERLEDTVSQLRRRLEVSEGGDLDPFEHCVTQQHFVDAGYAGLCAACGRTGHPFRACKEKDHVEPGGRLLNQKECLARTAALHAAKVAGAKKGK